MKKSVKGTKRRETEVKIDVWEESWTTLNDSIIPSALEAIEGFELGRNEWLFKKIDLKRD